MITRRSFLSQATVAAASMISRVRGSAGEGRARADLPQMRLAADPQRPKYHFLPKANWVNDPNGPIFWKGYYHLFYQYSYTINPQGPKYWGHARSQDLVFWEHLPMALSPTPRGPDKDGCWSGSAFSNNGVPTLVYTGVDPQVQCLATGDDTLINWKKLSVNPILAGPPSGLTVTGFRDPSIWRESDGWWMTVGAGFRSRGGAVLLYHSKDLLHWTYFHLLFSGLPFEPRNSNDSQPYDTVDAGDMWECPDFFPLGPKHVLLVSTQGRVHYFLGEYKNRRFEAESHGFIDASEMYYAAKSFVDAQGRRILWGWVREARSPAAQDAAGWSGAISLPRVLSIDSEGALRVEPAPELARLRGRHTHLAETELGDFLPLPQLTGASLDIQLVMDPGMAKQVGLSICRTPNAAEETTIFYDTSTRELVLDARRSSLNPGAGNRTYRGALKLSVGEPLRLSIFLDGSVVEVYANARTCLTGRVYPTRADSLGVGLFGHEGRARLKTLNAYVMKAISPDRLTGGVI